MYQEFLEKKKRILLDRAWPVNGDIKFSFEQNGECKGA